MYISTYTFVHVHFVMCGDRDIHHYWYDYDTHTNWSRSIECMHAEAEAVYAEGNWQGLVMQVQTNVLHEGFGMKKITDWLFFYLSLIDLSQGLYYSLRTRCYVIHIFNAL